MKNNKTSCFHPALLPHGLVNKLYSITSYIDLNALNHVVSNVVTTDNCG